MAAGRFDLIIEQGVDFAYTVRWSDGQSAESPGLPVNLSGSTVRAQIRYTYGAPYPPALELDADISDAANGEITLRATALETATLTKDGVWDLEIYDPSNKVTRLLSGRVQVSPEVTK